MNFSIEQRKALLNDVIDTVRRAEFDDTELPAKMRQIAELTESLATKRERDRGEEIDYWRGLCLRSEVSDYFGDYKAAKEVIGPAWGEWTKLQAETPVAVDKAVLRQRLWAVLHLSHTEYRSHEYDRAKNMLGDCERALDRLLPLEREGQSEDGEPSYGLRSRIAYSKARIARELKELAEARLHYTEAIDLQYRRLAIKAAKYKDNPDARSREQSFSNYMVAKCMGFGLGWINLKTGELKRAHASIGVARALLQTTGDTLHRGYADLLYAHALRAEGKRESLEEAIGILTRLVQETFSGHPRYRIRAHGELARAYYLMNLLEPEPLKSEEARSRVKGGLQKAKHNIRQLRRGGNEFWRVFAGILACRVRLAEARATPAEDKERRSALERRAIRDAKYVRARAKADRGLQVSSLIALAEAYVQAAVKPEEERYWRDAEDCLNGAIALTGKGNILDAAVCRLFQARIAVRRLNAKAAKEAFDQWKEYAEIIESGFVHQLAEEVKKEVDSLESTFILLADGSIDHETCSSELRRWLLKQARRRLGPERFGEEAHKLLGVSRQTVFNWRRDLDCYPPVKGA